MSSVSPPPSAAKKRKRDVPVEELEINVDAPEPPSKRALRRAKKGKPPQRKPRSPSPGPTTAHASGIAPTNGRDAAAKPSTEKERSEHGVWIGNLPFAADRTSLRAFLIERAGLGEDDITRVHMPAPRAPAAGGGHHNPRAKPTNKGFAYVDVDSGPAQIALIGMSETLMGGRALLIKDARSFVGRPKKEDGADGESKIEHKGHPPNKRVFIGNLDFDTDREEFRQHMEQCGPVDQVFLATFEDSGKCKGYAWVTFAELEGAERAVRGWVEAGDEEGSEATRDGGRSEAENGDEMPDRKARSRRIFVRTFQQRRLKMEFAEDAAVRYRKRFGRREKDAEPAEE